MGFRASISLKAGVTRVVPVADVAYVDMRVSGTTDATGRFRIIFETFAVLDRPSLRPIKTFPDGVSTSDFSIHEAEKNNADSVTLSDSVATLLLFLREFSNSVEADDVRTLAFTPATKQELVPIAEDNTYVLDKLVEDGFAMNDGADAIDGSQHSIAKGISNVAFVSATSTLIFNASRVESVGVSDAGLLTTQDYCDFSYFSEDYAGVARNF